MGCNGCLRWLILNNAQPIKRGPYMEKVMDLNSNMSGYTSRELFVHSIITIFCMQWSLFFGSYILACPLLCDQVILPKQSSCQDWLGQIKASPTVPMSYSSLNAVIPVHKFFIRLLQQNKTKYSVLSYL